MLTKENNQKNLINVFEDLTENRKNRNQLHKLIDIVIIAICAILCGANNWVQVAQFGRDKISWFQQFLQLPNGIPSHDTFNNFFRFLDPHEFEKKFIEWTESIAQLIPGTVVAIDGKTSRRSYDKQNDKRAIHCVSAFAVTNKITLGQVKTEDKSNEITAIPALLDILSLKGCIATIDAMGCQKEIAKKIIDNDADYILGLKRNQKTLFEEAENFFQQAEAVNFEDVPGVQDETNEVNRTRIEKRFMWATSDLEWLDCREEWTGLQTLIMIKSECILDGIKKHEKRYYISSLPADTPDLINKIRQHWGIETSLHWVLDVEYDEDKSRLRKDFGAQNFSLLRKLTLNMLNRDKNRKGGIETKRLSAGWNDKYREKLIECK